MLISINNIEFIFYVALLLPSNEFIYTHIYKYICYTFLPAFKDEKVLFRLSEINLTNLHEKKILYNTFRKLL